MAKTQHRGTESFKWDDFPFILAVARARTLADIARAMSIDATTVNRRLAAIETRANAVLFTRSHGRIALSRLGQQLVSRIETMEQLARVLSAEVSTSDVDRPIELRVSAPPSLSRYVLAPAIATLRERHPSMVINLDTTPTNVNIERWEADMVLRLSAPKEAAANVVRRKIGRMAYAPFGARGQVATDQWISYDRKFTHLPEVQWVEARLNGHAPVFFANDPEVIAASAAAGLGNAVLPTVLGTRWPTLTQVGPIAFYRDVWLLRPRHGVRSTRSQEAIDVLAELCRRALEKS